MGHRRVLLAMVLTMVIGLAQPTVTAAADRIRIPGTRVSLTMPEGFELAASFPGIAQQATSSSVMVTELPGPASEAQIMMDNAEALAGRGMQRLRSEVVPMADARGKLIHLTQSSGGVMFRKRMLIFGNEQTTVLLAATTPEALDPTLGAVLERTLLTASWDAGTQTGLFEGLPFVVQGTEALAIQQRVSNMVLLARPGQQAPITPGDPFLVIGLSISDTDTSDLARFAESRLAQMATIRDVAVTSRSAITVDGLPAYELVAEAKDRQTGMSLKVYQVIAPAARQYVIIQGLIGAAQAERYLPEFRRVTKTFKRTK